MKFLPLVWSMLWRSRTRTTLTFASIVVAFLLFGLLQAIESAFLTGVRMATDDRLMVTYRQGLTKLLPLSYRTQLEALDEVMAVQSVMFLGLYYQDPKNQVATLAVDATPDIDPRVIVSDAHSEAFQRTLTGALAGQELMARYGWKVGDRIPMKGWQKKDGSADWAFELVGTYAFDAEMIGQRVAAMNLIVRYAHYEEVTPYPGRVLWYTVRVHDAAQAGDVARAIDRMFANSEFETRTQTEAEFNRGFVRQFGDVGLMMTSILGAVFFTLLLVAGNTMMQAFRERIPELAVLKTLGFSDRRVAAMIAAESVVLCVGAAATGLGLAALAVPPIRTAMAQFLAGLHLESATIVSGLGIALALAGLSACIPAWRSARLTVVGALARA